jgi:hypothetical protein
LQLTGYIPTNRFGFYEVEIPPQGTLTLTPLTPTIDNNRVIDVGSTNSLTLTGAIPTLSYDWVITPAQASLNLTTYEPASDNANNVTKQLPKGSLTLTGQIPTLSFDEVANPGKGSLALTGAIPTISYDWVISPDQGALILASKTPAITQPLIISPSTKSLALTGNIPVVGYDWYDSPGKASLTLTGLAPAILGASPGTESLILSGLVPNLAYDWVIYPPVGSLTLSGIIPDITEIFSYSDYNAAAYFTTGSTVTIRVWNTTTGDEETLISNACVEVKTTGVFVWDSSKLANQPVKYQQYAWKMTDGTNSESGIMEVPGNELYWSLYRPLLRR